jgi:hypothetical protein
LNAAAASAIHPKALSLPASASAAAHFAGHAPPTKSAVEESAMEERVAVWGPLDATPTLTAVSDVASILLTALLCGSAKACDRFPNGFPCTRGGHSASVAAPAPAAPSTKRHGGGKRTE